MKKNSEEKIHEPIDSLVYDENSLIKNCNAKNIRRNAIMRAFGQSNSATAQRWLEGHDLYVSSLIKLCNRFNFEFLSFFLYRGHRFTTTLDQLARVESMGIDLGAITTTDIILPAENPTLDENTANNLKTIINTQKKLIEAQEEIIANLRTELDRTKEELRQRPVRYMVADETHIDIPNPIV